MNIIEQLLRKPHAILSLTLVFCFLGITGYYNIPTNLFPDTNRPTIAVVTKWAGATADDVAREVTHPIEIRLSALDGVRRVTSTSRDQVSLVQAEFEYGNNIDLAAARVETELKRVSNDLPHDTQQPLIFHITDAAHPAMVLSVSANKEAPIDLAQIYRIAANPLRDYLLNIPGIAEAEVFGGQKRQVAVDLDRNKLIAYDLNITEVAAALANDNDTRPAGLIERDGYRLLLTTRNLARTPEDLASLLVPVKGGGFVRVSDLGNVDWGYADPTSLYRGNNQDSVAISLLRTEQGNVSDVIDSMKIALPKIQKEFPMLDFQVTDTQGRLIDLTVSNMVDALRDAIIMSILVILLFLGNTRAAFIIALSLPLTYLLTFASMWALNYEFNMVTLTAIIIAVGMLADDAIVIIENIERHIDELGEQGLTAAVRGTEEIFLADFSGTFSTVIVLVPIIFIGGYVETVLQPLSTVLIIALIASFIVSVTIIPLLTPWILKPGSADPLGFLLRPFSFYILDPFKQFYVELVDWGLKNRTVILLLFFALFIFSAKQMSVVGRELMPLMDSGIFIVNFEAEPDTNVQKMQGITKQVDQAVRSSIPREWLISSSTIVGSEAGVRSFGAARTFQQGQSTVTIINRFERDQSLFEIEQAVRDRVQKIPGLIEANVSEYGASPLSSIRGSVDIMLSGPDWRVLDKLADNVMGRLSHVQGLTGIGRSWQGASRRVQLDIDPLQSHHFGLTVDAVANQVAAAIGGISGGRLRVTGEDPIPVWVRLNPEQRNDPEMIAGLPIRTPSGQLVPLSNIAKVSIEHEPTAHTHQSLIPTVDILGYRQNIAITHLQENVDAALEGIVLPKGYSLSHEGESKQMQESFGRLVIALALGMVLLFFSLVIIFRSFLYPLSIMATLPLALIGAAWAMMIADKHGCMPSFMGLILLMGIVVNNGILIVDFIQTALAEGKDLRNAILQAVELRTRPILMTAGATIVGMIPIAKEWAVGIERLSPLAVVAIGGLLAGTFLTLLIVPVLFDVLEQWRRQINTWRIR